MRVFWGFPKWINANLIIFFFREIFRIQFNWSREGCSIESHLCEYSSIFFAVFLLFAHSSHCYDGERNRSRRRRTFNTIGFDFKFILNFIASARHICGFSVAPKLSDQRRWAQFRFVLFLGFCSTIKSFRMPWRHAEYNVVHETWNETQTTKQNNALIRTGCRLCLLNKLKCENPTMFNTVSLLFLFRPCHKQTQATDNERILSATTIYIYSQNKIQFDLVCSRRRHRYYCVSDDANWS